MNELQKTINKAFDLISAIPVSGDGVEVMAAAKDALRQAYKMAEKERDSKIGELPKTNYEDSLIPAEKQTEKVTGHG